MIRFLEAGSAAEWMGRPVRRILDADVARHRLCRGVAMKLLTEWRKAARERK